MSRKSRAWLRFLRKIVLITVGAVVVMAVFGFVIGGVDGAQGGAMWGLAAGAMAIPGMLLGIALNAGDAMVQRRDESYERRFLDNHG